MEGWQTLASVATAIATVFGAITLMRSTLRGLRHDLEGVIRELKTDLVGSINELKKDIRETDLPHLEGRIDDYRGEIHKRLDSIRGDIREIRGGVFAPQSGAAPAAGPEPG